MSLVNLEKLLEMVPEKSETDNKIYHVGESHCLSYAHHLIKINKINFKICPRVIYGAKAFHFSQDKDNSFKALTKLHLDALPLNSKIFVSFDHNLI